MVRLQFHRSLIVGKSALPVFLFFFNFSKDKIGFRIFRVDLEHVTKRYPGLREIPLVDVVLSLSQIFGFFLFRAAASNDGKQQQDGHGSFGNMD